ncbi:MAG: thioesterase II family protein [Actinoallomurus sp.]
MTGVEDSWFVPLASSPGAVTLVCLPYAGARPGVFLPLARAFSEVNVLAVQLPGHGRRIRERPLTSMVEIVEGLVPAVTRAVQGKFVLFGHSMGALVGVELARALQSAGGPEPDHFIASACRAPGNLNQAERWHDLPDDELAATLVKLGAEPEALEHEELRQLTFPSLRADLEAIETYDPGQRPPLRYPITAVAGTEDPDAKPELMADWKRETTGDFRITTVAGGHFLLEERLADMVNIVRDVLG